MSCTRKIHNFGAGPSKLPKEVLEIIRDELLDFEGTGISIMETSHRSATYAKLNKEVQDVIRRLLNVPDNYKILFLPGGGQGMFSAVPINLISRTGIADYVVTGSWSNWAAREAEKYGTITYPLPKTDVYTDIPDPSTWNLNPNASYVHICSNETIDGIEFDFIPDTKGVPLVCDVSSHIFSKKIDVTKFGVIYATAQKNFGTAGVALVIVREDLLGKAIPNCPAVFNWTNTAKMDSILNTPPVFNIYVMGQVLQWVERQGGLDKMAELALQKSFLLYNVIDKSNGFYYSPVVNKVRSRINIPFRIDSSDGNKTLEEKFLQGAVDLGYIQLHGHNQVGGIRVSNYNAITLEEVENLVEYMIKFYEENSSAGRRC